MGLPLWVLGMPESLRIPMVEPREDEEAPALFSHGVHDAYRCYECHTGIFPQARVGFTHEEMDEGRYCGACHDGRTAWSPDDDDVECETCHVE